MSREIPLVLRASVEHRASADPLLVTAGDAVIVARERLRWFVMVCPCGCGDILPVNLDSRAGPAWRLYRTARRGISVYPSVWRETGCGSHFIIWRDDIVLFSRGLPDWRSPQDAEFARLQECVLDALPHSLTPYVELADRLTEVPWDVLSACRGLVRARRAVEGVGDDEGTFRRL